MTAHPDQIRQDIERTRSELSDDVNALGEKVAPRQVVRRRTERVRRMFGTARDKVMGSPAERMQDARGQLSTATDKASETASSAVSTVGEAASEAPRVARERVEGNPLAAGLVAFGLGWLASSLLPPSQREQQLTAQAKEQLAPQAQPMMEEAKGAAKEVAEHMREPAQQAADSVKGRAQEAASEVKEESKSAAQHARPA